MKKKFVQVIAVMALLGVAFGVGKHTVTAKEEGKIYDGVYLDSVYVGGLTKEEAMKQYGEYVKNIGNLTLTFTTDNGNYKTQLSEIDIKVSAEDAVNQAYGYGRSGNLLSRYKEIKTLEQEDAVLIPTKSFSKDGLKKKLETETKNIVQEAVNASVTREDGEFIVKEGQKGIAIDSDKTVEEFAEFLEKPWNQENIELKAAVKETKPEYDVDDFKMIDSVLGQAVTSYSQGNSNRSKNLSVGASRVSGTLLLPGEQFSMDETLGPRTEENGYYAAGQYVNNELTDGAGGGVCQVSTTLYNAVLKAELQVDERHPHTLTVGYVDRSKDAAIAEGLFDFKFTNSTGYPIYIEGYAGGGTISFAVYGHETRDANRTIEFVSKTLETYEPDEPEKIMDDTLEEGKTVTEEEPHTGYYCELWKNIYIDGVLQDSVRVNQSQYSKTKGKVRVGTMKVEPSEEPSEENSENQPTTEQKTEKPTTETPTTEKPTPDPEPEPESPEVGQIREKEFRVMGA